MSTQHTALSHEQCLCTHSKSSLGGSKSGFYQTSPVAGVGWGGGGGGIMGKERSSFDHSAGLYRTPESPRQVKTDLLTV